MNNKLLYGVMTAQLLIMSTVQIHNNDVVSRKNAEINKQDKIIAEFKQVDKLQERALEEMSVQIDETSAKLQESERLRNEQNKAIEDQNATIASQQNTINQLRAELQQAKQVQPTQVAKTDGRVLQMVASAYTNHPSENGTYGGKVVTRTGYDISNTIKYNGMGIVAADPSVIPLNSVIDIEGLGRYIVLDTGSAIKGNRLDVLMANSTQANNWGRRTVSVTIVKRG